MYFSNEVALLVTLLAAAMWGSWFQCLKHLGDYPYSGFVLWLYTASLVLVWGVVLVFGPMLLPEGIGTAMEGKFGRVLMVMVCGAFMSVGLHMQIGIMGRIGMILSTAISGAIGSIFGVVVTVIAGGGLPANLSLGLVILSTVILVVASYICTCASSMRDKDIGNESKQNKVDLKTIFILIVSNLFVTGYAYGFSAGTQTDSNPNGLPPLLCVAFLATGSFIGVAASTGFLITRNKQWKQILHPGSVKPFLAGIISGLCHYGGNILSIFATPVLSAAISFLLGRTANMWTYFWGIVYGEFSGAKRKTVMVLILGILAYITGVLLLAVGMYR